MKLGKLIALTLLATSLGHSAQAVVVGSSVTGSLSIPGFGTILSETATVVDPGAEFVLSVGTASLSLDLAEDDITVIYDLTGFSDVGLPTTWSVSGFTDVLTGVSLTSGDASLVSGTSFDAGSFTIDFFNITSTPNVINTFVFDIETTATIPLPAGGVLLVSGMLGLAGTRSKKARTA